MFQVVYNVGVRTSFQLQQLIGRKRQELEDVFMMNRIDIFLNEKKASSVAKRIYSFVAQEDNKNDDL